MILLQDILYKVAIKSVVGHTNILVENIQIDSRKIKSNGCFLALRGVNLDASQFIDAAIANGATSIICEEIPATQAEGVTYIQCQNISVAAGIIAHSFYGEPSSSIKLVGITGTNGKTTIATLLYKLYTELGYKTGLISTVNNQIGNEKRVILRCCSTLLFSPYQNEINTNGKTTAARIMCEIKMAR